MSDSGNGFSDMADYFGNLSDVVEEVAKDSLEEAANFYLKQLIPNIPRSLLAKKHMSDQIKVTIEKEKVVVHFDGAAFYWRFVENGTVNQKAQHFASGTYESNKTKIENILTTKLMKELEG